MLTFTEFVPRKKEDIDLEVQQRRKQYPIPLSEKNRNEILRRCEILKYMGDCSIMSDFYESSDQDLVDEYSWVLDKEHDDLAEPFNITIWLVNISNPSAMVDFIMFNNYGERNE